MLFSIWWLIIHSEIHIYSYINIYNANSPTIDALAASLFDSGTMEIISF